MAVLGSELKVSVMSPVMISERSGRLLAVNDLMDVTVILCSLNALPSMVKRCPIFSPFMYSISNELIKNATIFQTDTNI